MRHIHPPELLCNHGFTSSIPHVSSASVPHLRESSAAKADCIKDAYVLRDLSALMFDTCVYIQIKGDLEMGIGYLDMLLSAAFLYMEALNCAPSSLGFLVPSDMKSSTSHGCISLICTESSLQHGTTTYNWLPSTITRRFACFNFSKVLIVRANERHKHANGLKLGSLFAVQLFTKLAKVASMEKRINRLGFKCLTPSRETHGEGSTVL